MSSTPRRTAAMSPTVRANVARKGGQAVSRDKKHMSAIGKKGGQAVSKNREHMAAIGRKGGSARSKPQQKLDAPVNPTGTVTNPTGEVNRENVADLVTSAE